MAPQRWFNSIEHTMNMHPEKNGEECDIPDTINHLLQDCSTKEQRRVTKQCSGR